MTEVLLKNFERKNPDAAEDTYRYVWTNLQSNGVRVASFRGNPDQLNLPLSEEAPDRKLLIPATTIMRVAGMDRSDALGVTGLSARRNAEVTLLGNNQTLASFREVSARYQRYLDIVTPITDRETKGSRLMIPVAGLGYLAQKISQNWPGTPEILQGRLFDFMAVPTLLIMFRARAIHFCGICGLEVS